MVEIFLIDEGFAYDVSHPFHLHGQSFYVVAMERHAKNPSNIGPLHFEGNAISFRLLLFLYLGMYYSTRFNTKRPRIEYHVLSFLKEILSEDNKSLILTPLERLSKI